MRLVPLKVLCITILVCILRIPVKAQVIPDSLKVDWSHAGYNGTIPSPALIINVKDFGAYGDSIHDDYNAVMSAINSSSNLRVIFFPAGAYLIKSPVALPANVVLRGEGSDKTNLCFNLTGGNCIDVASNQSKAFLNIDSGYYKRSDFLSVSNTSAFNAGSFAEIRETNGAWDIVPASWATFCVGQIVKIKSVDSKSLVIQPALHIDYTKSLQPKIRVITPIQNTGIECLKITRIDSTPNNYGYNIRFLYAENCWVSGVESNKSQGSHIMLNASANVTISGCYFHDAYTYDGTGTAGYGVTLIQHTSDCKIENSVFSHLRHSMVAKQGANGNVFAYNYSANPFRSETPNDAGGDLLLHGHYAFANLFEGNISQNIIIDEVWGPSGPYNTFFRNRAELYGIIVIDTTISSAKENFVGNEVTGSGIDSGYPLGNYVIPVNNEFTYANNIRDTIQPFETNVLTDSSCYLKAQPYYWNITSAWPSIGIPNIINSENNPAKERYLSTNIITSCIKEQNALSAIVTADSITCNGSVTEINITASGGTSPYQYSIDGINFQSENSFLEHAGAYTITVADANADTVSASINFKQPPVLTASLKKTNLTCNNDSSGSITVTTTGGIKPYQYSLNAGIYQSSNVFKNLKAGAYNISIKDARGCILNMQPAIITQPSAISIAYTKKDVSCKNANDGSITVTASKGASPYQHNLNGGVYQTSNNFTGLAAGSYIITVKDAKGCTASKPSVKINNSTKSCSVAMPALNNKFFDVKVFPNPSVNYFSLILKTNSSAMIEIRVTDAYGKQLYHTKGTANETYNFGANLIAGIYFLEVIQDANMKVLKLIRQ